MDDKRLFNRWFREGDDKAVVTCSDHDKDVGDIIDVSAGGMRVALHKQVGVGEEIYGQFNIMDYPYYIKGRVSRVFQLGTDWEVAISFDKVSSLPLA